MYSSALLGCALHYILHRVRDFYFVLPLRSAPPFRRNAHSRRRKRYIWPRMDKANMFALCTRCECVCACFYVFREYSQQKEVKSNDLHLRHGHPITMERNSLYLAWLLLVDNSISTFFLSPFRPRQFFLLKILDKLSFFRIYVEMSCHSLS